MKTKLSMGIVTHRRTKYYATKKIFGGSATGGSLWGRIKAAAKRIFGSRTGQKALSAATDKIFSAAPGLINKGLSWLSPRLAKSPLGKYSNDITSGIQKAAEMALSKGKEVTDAQIKKLAHIEHKSPVREPPPAVEVSSPVGESGGGILSKARSRMASGAGKKRGPKHMSMDSSLMVSNWMK